MRGPNSPDHWFFPDTRLRFVYPGDQVIVLDLSIFFKQINQPLNEKFGMYLRVLKKRSMASEQRRAVP